MASVRALKPQREIITNAQEVVPWAAYVDRYLKDCEAQSPHTYRAKRGDLDVFGMFAAKFLGISFPSMMAGDISKGVYEAFRFERLQIEARSTVARRMATVKHLGSWMTEQYGTRNQSRGVSAPLIHYAEFKGLTDAQMLAVVRKASELHPRDRFIFELLSATGLRNSEACALRFQDICDAFETITVTRGKGGRQRSVPVSADLRKCLMRYLIWRHRFDPRPQAHVLVAKHGKGPISPRAVWEAIHRLLFSAGVPPALAHPHTLRHTFAQRLLRHISPGRPAADALRIVREVLGHANLEMTMRYLTTHSDERKAALRDFI